MIKKEGGKFVVKSKTGKNLGKYSSKKKAEERMNQVEMFKHMEEKKKGKK